MNRNEALDHIKEHDAEASGFDKRWVCRFSNVVTMSHSDGTFMHLDGAYAYEIVEHNVGDCWLVIATEHHGYFAYELGEITGWEQFNRS